MKKLKLIAGVLISVSTFAHAATNDLTTVLQKGLFEEEANHNLGAAIQLYEAVVAQFDRDRKLAATAVFRLGECYRKQGRTNDATAQYERVLREFPDQDQLAAVARQNLLGLGGKVPVATSSVATDAARQEQKRLYQEEIKLVEKKLAADQKRVETGVASQEDLWTTQRQLLELKRKMAAVDIEGPGPTSAGTGQQSAEAKADAAALQAQIGHLRKMPPTELRIAIQQEYPNPVLTSLMQKLAESEQNLAALNREFGPNHSEVLAERARYKTIDEQIEAQVKGVLNGLAAKEKEAAARAATLAQPQSAALAPDSVATSTSAEAEEVKRIQAMIKDSPDLINAADPNAGRMTPLIKAAMNGQLVVARFLLGAGANLESEGSDGRTALYWAAYQGHKGMVEILLAGKANVGSPDSNRRTPLHAAAERGFRSVAEVLLANGANVNAADRGKATPLHYAVANGFRSIAELLLDKGADINANAVEVRFPSLIYRGTALTVAASRGDLALCELLLNRKADPELAYPDGLTPLHIAARDNALPFAQLLLSKGARVDTKNTSEANRGWTALHFAVVAGSKEMVDLLLQNKADPNARIEAGFGANRYSTGGPSLPGQNPPPATGYTPLLLATAKCYSGIVGALLAANADPNAKSDSGDTPIVNTITLCSIPERHRILALLLDHGAKTESADPSGSTALYLAADNRDRESLELLLKHKADPNARNRYGYTPLHVLAFTLSRTGLSSEVNLMATDLIEAKADVNLQTADGRTPLKFATELLLRPGPHSGDETIREFAELLRKAGAVEDLPQLDRIEVSRSSAGYRAVGVWKGTNDYNQFSLFELVAMQYGFCGRPAQKAMPARPGLGVPTSGGVTPGPGNALSFPDFSKVVIRRATPDGKSRKEMQVPLASIFDAGQCSGDIPLKWGDVVEIPEADHPINVNWQGLPEKARNLLVECLGRTVEVRVKGQSTNMVLKQVIPGPLVQFSLQPVLVASGLLRASSDLSRVKVTRHDPSIGQSYEMQVDCSPSTSDGDLWLRQGDVIEVPEKP